MLLHGSEHGKGRFIGTAVVLLVVLSLAMSTSSTRVFTSNTRQPAEIAASTSAHSVLETVSMADAALADRRNGGGSKHILSINVSACDSSTLYTTLSAGIPRAGFEVPLGFLLDDKRCYCPATVGVQKNVGV